MEEYKKAIQKHQPQQGTKNLSYLMDHILYQIFKIILSVSSKKHKTVADDSPIRIYVNRIERRITFKIRIRYYLELLTPETMKLLENTNIK